MDQQGQDGNYFISMTDMMVGVLFVFIIIVSYFVMELQKTVENNDVISRTAHERIVEQKDQEIILLMEEIEKLKRQSWELYAAAANNKRSEIIQAISQKLEQQGIKVNVDLEVGVIRLEGDGLFNQTSSNLSERAGALELINQLSGALYNNIRCYGLHKEEGLKPSLPEDFESCNPDQVFVEAVYVEGHSDSDPLRGTLKDGSRNNLELSARRATNTYAQMVTFTPSLTKIVNPFDQQALSTAAYGSQRPIKEGYSTEAKAANRRIDLRFVMYLPKDEAARAELQSRIERMQ